MKDSWQVTLRTNKTCVQLGNKPCLKAGKLPYTVVYTCGRLMCSSCGVSFKKTGKDGVAVVDGSTSYTGRYRIKEATHNRHCIHTAKVEGGADILFCSLGGADVAHRAVRLEERCQPQDKSKRLGQCRSLMVK